MISATCQISVPSHDITIRILAMHMSKMLRIQSGQKINSTFSAEEYAARQAKLCAHGAAENIDAAIFAPHLNATYCSDFCIAPAATAARTAAPGCPEENTIRK
jgi:Tfp pilus assembly protein PilV